MRDHRGSVSGPLGRALEALNDHSIDYVVLRDYLSVSALNDSPDIDIYIPEREMARAIPLLQAAGWLKRRWQTGRFPHVFLDHLGNVQHFATVLDVVTGLNFGHRLHQLRNPEAILRSGRMWEGMRVPSQWHALFLLTLHSLLDKRHLTERHLERIRLHWRDCLSAESSPAQLSDDFGTEAVALCTDFVEAIGENPASSLAALRTRARTLRCLRSRRAFATVHRGLVGLRKKRQRPARIGVIGLDGAGKSTLIEKFERTAGIPTGSGYLGNNRFVSRLVRVQSDMIDSLARDPRRKNQLAIRLLSALGLFLWPIEFSLRVRRAEGGRMLVFYDRYPIPGLDPAPPPSSPLGFLRRRIKELGSRVIPKADLVLFFDGDAQVLWPRKQEYPYDVYVETQTRYRRVVEGLACETYTIDTAQAMAETWAQLVAALTHSPTLRRVLYLEGPHQILDDSEGGQVD